MAVITPNLKLTVWNQLTDPYDSSQLAQNFISIDQHDHSDAKGVRIPNTGLVSTSGSEAVNTNVIRDNAVTTVKIINSAITTDKINNLAVTTAKIDSLAVTTDKIDDSAITSDKIDDDAVTSDAIAEDAVGSSEIAPNAVTSTELLSDVSVDANRAVTTNHIKDSAVTSDKIADGAIVNADINASAAIADTKLATISTAGKVSNSATTATNANTNSAIVARDASGNFAAEAITATTFNGALVGAAPAGSLSGTTLKSTVVNSSLTSLGTQVQALNMGGFAINNLPTTPSASTDAASKSYVDQMSVGLSKKSPVAVATTGAEYYTVAAGVVTKLHFGSNPSIDGYSLANAAAWATAGTRILVKDAPTTNVTNTIGSANSTSSANGIYYVSSVSSNDLNLTRATDMDVWSEVQNAYVLILNGTVNGATSYTADVSATTSGTINTTAFKFTQFTAKVTLVAGNGINVSGNQISTNLATSNPGLEYSGTQLKISADQSSTITTLGNVTVGTISGATWSGNTIANTYLPDATTSAKGIASFDSGDFAVSSGAVTVKSGGIDNAQLANSKVTIGSTDVNLGSSATTITGLTSVTSTGFTGALTGNADTATKLAATKNINGVAFDGSANINVPTQYSLTAGTGLTLDSGTTFNGSAAKTISIGTSVATLTGTQALSNKTLTLSAGSTSIAPIQLTPTAASLLTSPTAGAIEVGSDGTLYYTPSSTRKTVAFTGDTISSNSQLPGAGTINIGSSAIALGGSAGTSSGNKITGLFIDAPTISSNPVFTALSTAGFVKNSSGGVLSSVTNIAASDFASQTANTVLAGPESGSSAPPTFRKIVGGDIKSDAAISVASVTTTGDVTVGGNLNITGSIDETSVTNLKVTDKTITVANGATTSSATDGAGIIAGTWSTGTVPSITWNNANSRWNVNKPIDLGTNKISSVTDPTSAQDAATKNYIDATYGSSTTYSVNHHFYISNNTSTPDKQIKAVADPSADQDAATKKYVDRYAIGPMAILTRTSAANISAGTYVNYVSGGGPIFNTVSYDNSSMAVPALGSMIVPFDGIYLIEAHILWDKATGSPTGSRGIRIIEYGSFTVSAQNRVNFANTGTSGIKFPQSISAIVKTTANTEWAIEVLQSNTGNSNWALVTTTDDSLTCYPTFSMRYLGA